MMPMDRFNAFINTLTHDQAQTILEMMHIASNHVNAASDPIAIETWLNTTVVVPDTIIPYMFPHADVA